MKAKPSVGSMKGSDMPPRRPIPVVSMAMIPRWPPQRPNRHAPWWPIMAGESSSRTESISRKCISAESSCARHDRYYLTADAFYDDCKLNFYNYSRLY